MDSYKYLQSLGKMPDPEKECVLFTYGFEWRIELTAKEFENFIKLYNKDWMSTAYCYDRISMLEDQIIKNLLADKRNKIIYWD